ncbi:uncharacterized protein LOC125490476 [Plutella xylostella]|nr:uncharacterized protein LOC125490476 [Plutella xylostella]
MKQEFPKPLPALPKPQPPPSKPQSPAASLFGSAPAPAAAKSPINQLYETYPGLQFHCTFGDGTPLESTNPPLQLSYSMRFKVVCVIKDQQFEGYGSSKKLAKLAAARSALARLQEGAAPAPPPPSAAQPHPLPQGLADHVAKLV